MTQCWIGNALFALTRHFANIPIRKLIISIEVSVFIDAALCHYKTVLNKRVLASLTLIAK